MATTYIKPYKKASDKSAVQTMQERFEYALNPEKLGAVSSYLCDHTTAHSEFLLVHSQYKAETGREADRGTLFYQIRQAFKPGEITPDEANRIGYETAMRWTKGKYQFFVCTHMPKPGLSLTGTRHPNIARNILPNTRTNWQPTGQLGPP